MIVESSALTVDCITGIMMMKNCLPNNSKSAHFSSKKDFMKDFNINMNEHVNV